MAENQTTLEQAVRRASLLAAAAEVSQNATQILDIDELMPRTVDIICDAYGFYYAGVFLIDAAGEYAVLRAGRGEPGRVQMANNHRLAVGGNSMIGACTGLNEARISLDVDTEKVWYPNPILPKTRSEMALPLAIGQRVIGAVTVQSTEEAAFSDEDISSLQAMANQLAIAIDNARKRRELQEAHAALLRARTFEAIASATGDAIHWIGNKAEPIQNAADRVRHDVQLLVCAVDELLRNPRGIGDNHPLVQLLGEEAAVIRRYNPDTGRQAEKLLTLSKEKLARRLSADSVMEDLEIIDQAGRLILQVKEKMIGPAREQAPRPTMLDDVLHDAIANLAIPPEIIALDMAAELPLGLADAAQLHRVIDNLVYNAYEAMEEEGQPEIRLQLQAAENDDFIILSVTDNGPGIPAGELDKIWGTFHTTKASQGHAGLGLPAARLILDHIGGDISAVSEAGQGATFNARIPVYAGIQVAPAKGQGHILLVDDDDRWRRFAVQTLTDSGFHVDTAVSKATDFSAYDLILADDILADAPAQEAIDAAQNAGALGKTLVVSSRPVLERTKERKLLGLYDLVTKPYTPAGLVTAVTAALNDLQAA